MMFVVKATYTESTDLPCSLVRRLGRAIAEAVSRWLPTAAARVRFPLPFIPPNSPSSQPPGAGTIGQSVADVPSGPSLDSTPHYAN
jgi:hypothetical protein